MDTSNKKVSKANVKIDDQNSFNTACFYQWATQVFFVCLFLLVSITMLIVRCNFTPGKCRHDRRYTNIYKAKSKVGDI